jgi:hypothetical protein
LLSTLPATFNQNPHFKLKVPIGQVDANKEISKKKANFPEGRPFLTSSAYSTNLNTGKQFLI